MKKTALFLDRDGVINHDYGYVNRKEDFHFIEGIFDLCRHAKARGLLIFVITNQSGIERGYYTEADFLYLTDWMKQRFIEENVPLDGVYYCSAYTATSYFRKPQPGMILQAAEAFDIDLENSILIGNKETDIQAGIAAKVKYNVLYSDHPVDTKATAIVSHLRQVITLYFPPSM